MKNIIQTALLVGEEVIQVMFTFKKVIPLNQCSYT